MDYVRETDQLSGMEGWSEEKWWCGRAGGAALLVGGMGDQLSRPEATITSPEAAQTVAEDGTFDSEETRVFFYRI